MEKKTIFGAFFLLISLSLIPLSANGAFPGQPFWQCKKPGITVVAAVTQIIMYWINGTMLINGMNVPRLDNSPPIGFIILFSSLLVFGAAGVAVISDLKCYQGSAFALIISALSTITVPVILLMPMGRLWYRGCSRIHPLIIDSREKPDTLSYIIPRPRRQEYQPVPAKDIHSDSDELLL